MKRSVNGFRVALVASFAVLFSVGWSFSTLSRSVDNERDAAIDRAANYLASAQNENGSWGTNDLRTSSLCLIALGGDGLNVPENQSKAVRKGAGFLALPVSTNHVSVLWLDNLANLAWRDMALNLCDSIGITSGVTDREFCELVKQYGQSSKHDVTVFSEFSMAAVMEAMRLRNVVCRDDALHTIYSFSFNTNMPCSILYSTLSKVNKENLRAELLSLWETKQSAIVNNAEYGWWFARAVNRHFNGELISIKDGNFSLIDWRSSLAGAWITSQSMDDRGFGYWKNPIETAFAILLLKEL